MKDTNILTSAGADINKSLELLGDMDMYNEVLSDFLKVIDEKISNLNKCKSINDMANYAIEVHALKSDVRYLGFMALGDQAYELEMLSKANDLVGVSSKHDALIANVNKVVNACKKYMFGEEEKKEEDKTIDEILAPTEMDAMSQALMYQGSEVKKKAASSSKGGVILIVEDSNMVANFIKKVFEKEYEVVIYNDGAGAIRFCSNDEKRSRIKACLLDLNMPNVDGFEVMDFLKERNYFVKLPVVVISGVENPETIQRAKSYPIVEVLAKPFNERDVEMALHKCLALYD